jgi:hypothetical protein
MPGSSICFGSWMTSSHLGVMAPGDSDSGNSLAASAGIESSDRRLAVCVGAYTSSDVCGHHLLFAALLRRRHEVRTSSEVASSFGTARWSATAVFRHRLSTLVTWRFVACRGLELHPVGRFFVLMLSSPMLRRRSRRCLASTSVECPILVVGARGLRVSQLRWFRLTLGLDFGPGCSSFGSGARSMRWSTEVGFGWLLAAMLASVQLANRLVRIASRVVACDPCAPRCTCTARFGVSVDSGRYREHDARGACTQLCSFRWMQRASARVDRECRLRPVGFVPLAGRWVLRSSARWWPDIKRAKAAVMRYGYWQGGFFEGCEPRCGNGFAIQPPVGRLRPCGAENGT